MLATDPLVHGKNMINDWVWDQTQGVVQFGPFKGMKLLREEAWKDGNLGTKIIGCYEMELHQPLLEEIDRLRAMPEPIIANVGCAEGYYAIGLARRLPKAKVLIVDISIESVDIAHRTADLNGVSLKTCDVYEALEKPDLVIMDCEGAEIEYLDLERHPGLRRATIIMESHECEGFPVNNTIANRFCDTHDIYKSLAEEARNPNTLPLLDKLASHYRWLAVSEGRPNVMSYLVMRPR